MSLNGYGEGGYSYVSEGNKRGEGLLGDETCEVEVVVQSPPFEIMNQWMPGGS